ALTAGEASAKKVRLRLNCVSSCSKRRCCSACWSSWLISMRTLVDVRASAMTNVFLAFGRSFLAIAAFLQFAFLIPPLCRLVAEEGTKCVKRTTTGLGFLAVNGNEVADTMKK